SHADLLRSPPMRLTRAPRCRGQANGPAATNVGNCLLHPGRPLSRLCPNRPNTVGTARRWHMVEWLADVNWIHLVTIPVFTGVIGWLINWTGLIMLFHPVRFHGIRIPGLQDLSVILPRKVQEVPGILQGGIGWQGIIPARAAKMG